MTDSQEAQQNTMTLGEFWPWLKRHFNCIIRMGGPGFLLYDQPDVHWHLSEEPEEGIFVAQVYRDKELCAEIIFPPEEIAYVQSIPDQGEHTLFEFMGQLPGMPEHAAICHVLLAHGYEENQPTTPRWKH